MVAAVGAAGLLAFGAAACGSDSNSDTTTGGGASGGTINGSGSTFAAPIYQQWGSALKGQGLTVNY